MRHLALFGLLALCACKTIPTAASTCLPMATYTPQQQKALAAALAAIPNGSALALAMIDYEAMRDADRACLGAKP